MISAAEKARKAVGWNILFNLFRDGLQFMTMLIVVRRLEPESYGHFALACAITGFVSLLSQNNFLAHIFQPGQFSNKALSDHFKAGLGWQLACALSTNLIALELSNRGKGEVASLLHVLSIGYLVEWPCEVRRKMLEYDMNWKRLRALHAIGLIGCSVLTVVMALQGWGAYSLVVPSLVVGTPFVIDLLIVKKWRPQGAFSFQSYRHAINFGLVRSASAATSTGKGLIESTILTSAIGAANLGIYGRGVSLGQLLCVKPCSQLLYSIYPLLTRKNQIHSHEYAYTIILRLILWTAIPTAAAASLCSSVIVDKIYGEKWTEVAGILPFAMWASVPQAVSLCIYTFILSKSRQRICLILDLTAATLTLGCCITLASQGAVIYAAGTAVASTMLCLATCVLAIRIKALNAQSVIGPLLESMMGTGIASVSTWLLMGRHGFGQEKPLTWLCCWLFVFGVCYLASMRALCKEQMRTFVHLSPASNKLRVILRMNK